MPGPPPPRPHRPIAIAATKADHVPALHRQNLEGLLRALVAPALAATRAGPGDVTTHAVVRGTILGTGTARLFDPGTVPPTLPPEASWQHRHFVLPVFEPPRGEAIGPRGIPSLGMDALLLALLGDKL